MVQELEQIEKSTSTDGKIRKVVQLVDDTLRAGHQHFCGGSECA